MFWMVISVLLVAVVLRHYYERQGIEWVSEKIHGDPLLKHVSADGRFLYHITNDVFICVSTKNCTQVWQHSIVDHRSVDKKVIAIASSDIFLENDVELIRLSSALGNSVVLDARTGNITKANGGHDSNENLKSSNAITIDTAYRHKCLPLSSRYCEGDKHVFTLSYPEPSFSSNDGYKGVLRSYEPKSRTLIWYKDVDGGSRGAFGDIVLSGDHLYLVNEYEILKIDPDTGQTIHKFSPKPRMWGNSDRTLKICNWVYASVGHRWTHGYSPTLITSDGIFCVSQFIGSDFKMIIKLKPF